MSETSTETPDVEGPGDTHDNPAPVEQTSPDAPDPVSPDVELDEDGSVASTEAPDEPQMGDHDTVLVSSPLVPDEGPAPYAPYDPSGRI